MSELKNTPNRVESIARVVKVVSVVIGVVLSVLSFNASRQKEAEARQAEAETRKFELQKYYDQKRNQDEKAQLEATKPFLELRQRLYLEAIQSTGVIVNPSSHDPQEVAKATKRFWELFWAELCMVESGQVEAAMIGLAETVTDTASPEITRQQASVKLAHVLRDSLLRTWGITDEAKIGPVNP